MAVLTGKSGAVKIATNTVAEIDDWSLDIGPELEETQSFGDSWKEFTANLLSASGSFSGRYDNTDTNGHIALRTAALAGTTVALRLYEDSDNYYSGNAYVRLSLNTRVGETIKASYAFTPTGTWSYT